MAKDKQPIKIFIDPYGNTVNFWWGDPADSAYSEEAKDSWDVIVMDKKHHPIGFEKIGFFPKELDPMKYLKEQIKFLLEAKERIVE